MKKKILFVVTSHDRLGNTNNPTGYYLSEVSHPWSVLISAGYEIDFVSPKGGKAPAEAVDLTDEINKAFWENSVYRFKIEHTLNPKEVNPVEYIAVFYAGGHGVMWDYPNNQDLGRIAQTIYENGGVVSAVCHAPAALLDVKLSNGELLIKDRKINSFTNEEERFLKTDSIVPFMLETELKKRDCLFEKYDMFASSGRDYHFYVTDSNGDGRVIEYDCNSNDRKLVVTKSPAVTNFFVMYKNFVKPYQKNGVYGHGRERYDKIINVLEKNNSYTKETAWEALVSASQAPNPNDITFNTL